MRRPKRKKFQHRRRKEQKTNFKKRLSLLKSDSNRLVVRKSLNGVTCQLVQYRKGTDKTLFSTNFQDLKKEGWNVHTGNIPSAYLTGLLFGVRAKQKNIKSAVLDTGLYASTKGSVIYAALKGVVDAGVTVPHSGDILPTDDRLLGKHIETYASSLKESDKFKKLFSSYIKNKIDPTKMSTYVEDTKAKILNQTKPKRTTP